MYSSPLRRGGQIAVGVSDEMVVIVTVHNVALVPFPLTLFGLTRGHAGHRFLGQTRRAAFAGVLSKGGGGQGCGQDYQTGSKQGNFLFPSNPLRATPPVEAKIPDRR